MQFAYIVGGIDNQRIKIQIEDIARTDGGGLTGLTNASTGLTAYYSRQTDPTATAMTLIAKSGETHQPGAFDEIDATNMPGLYELHLLDAMIQKGFGQCLITLKGAVDMAETHILIIDTRELRSGYCRFRPIS